MDQPRPLVSDRTRFFLRLVRGDRIHRPGFGRDQFRDAPALSPRHRLFGLSSNSGTAPNQGRRMGSVARPPRPSRYLTL